MLENKRYNFLLLRNRRLCAEININDFSDISECLDKTGALLSGGADIITLSNLNTDDRTLLEIAVKIKQLCSEFDALFIMKSRCDIACLCDADGIFLSKGDLNITDAKKILKDNIIVGMHTDTEQEVLDAIKNGVDYISIRPIFSTPDKPAADTAGLEYAKWVSENISIPAFAENINQSNISRLLLTGISRITIDKALTNSISPNAAAKKLAETLKSNS